MSFLSATATAATLYVDLNNPAPATPYTNWVTAATNIQNAVDAAAAGDEIVVTNGTYQTGGRVVYGSMTNRVAVTRAVTVRSVNGPQATFIQGYQHPSTTNGTTAVRCVWLTNGAALIGFTLTNGATRSTGDIAREQSGGGVWCASASGLVSNCMLTGNSAYYYGGGAYSNTLVNCTLSGNTARSYGGGAYSGSLTNCTLSSNRASSGGGAYSGTLKSCSLFSNSATSGGGTYSTTLTNCTLAGNFASSFGGGAYSSTLNACTLTNNSAADDGAGAYQGSLTNCLLAGNVAADDGGGAYQATLVRCTLTNNIASPNNGGGGGAIYSTLYNCTLLANSAAYGGGAYQGTLNNCVLAANVASQGGAACSLTSGSGTLNNCTLTGNTAGSGGGAAGVTLNNCIVYYNRAPSAANYSGGSLNYCCTTPLPAGGVGNIEAEPQLADAAHLSAGSPCRGAGSATYAKGTDIDGEPWATTPSIGCDEFNAGPVLGPLAVSLQADYTNVTLGFSVDLTAWIDGRATGNRWEFGDGTVVSNRLEASHNWSTPGDYTVVFRAYNDSNPGGVSSTVTVHAVTQPVHYVALGNTGSAPPFTSWATAATNIQDAVDAATVAGARVVVSNGVYRVGGRVVSGAMTNRVAVPKPLELYSVNGPEVTIIQGAQVPATTNGDSAVRCVFLADGATLAGFTLTNGATRASGDSKLEQSGGGVWCPSVSSVVSNCVITGNSANSSGGGAYSATLVDSELRGNSTPGSGGGAASGTLTNCTIAGNSAFMGGGINGAVGKTCLLSNNTAYSGGGALTCTLIQCALTGNSVSHYGGGAWGGTLDRCTLTGNSADLQGGGANSSTMRNSVLTGNSALQEGGGAYNCTLNNCTVTGNSSPAQGGGTCSSTLNNCILYYNTAPVFPNYAGTNLNYCCTTPLPGSGAGNIGLDPQLASTSHLSSSSPCRGTGSAALASGTDIDGEPWASLPSIGCDEYYAGAVTGALTVSILANYTTVTPGFSIQLAATTTGRVSATRWEFSDGTIVTNQPCLTRAWNVLGDYPVVLTAYNESNPGGVSATSIVHVIEAPLHYVALQSAAPLTPYNSWATAATNIQDAVDAATVPGAFIIVSNGVYNAGGRVAFGGISNRVVVAKPLIVRSANGPEVTLIAGRQAPGSTNGDSAMRCVYLRDGAALVGFTLTNGATRSAGSVTNEQSGGGVWCVSTSALISNCVIAANSAATNGGGAFGGTLKNCLLTNNTAFAGGGAYSSVLTSCNLAGNAASSDGGGAYCCTLTLCTVAGNSSIQGGGASLGILSNCTLAANFASSSGGGAYSSALLNCRVTGNRSSGSGGGTYGGTLQGCMLAANSAGQDGGGAYFGLLQNCTLTGNSSGRFGGGSYYATLKNCIIYYNQAPGWANYAVGAAGTGGSLNYCCTTPLPDGSGNISAEPQLASSSHISWSSPCRGAGSTEYASGIDIDGEAWATPPSIGCDELTLGRATGAIMVSIAATFTNVSVGFGVDFAGANDGRLTAGQWEFAGSAAVTNQPYITHAWGAPGDYAAVYRAYNESNPGGISTTVMVHVVEQPVHYVVVNNPALAAPFTSWATAATNIQDAVDAATVPGALILVSNGVYRAGGRVVSGAMTNRVAVTTPLLLQSVNGPGLTTIEGYQVPGPTNGESAVRCVYLTNDSRLCGFTVRNGATRAAGDSYTEQSGGGIWCTTPSAVVSNCILSGNGAYLYGGGACSGTLTNCTVVGNVASWYGFGGGGTYLSTLNNCLVSSNAAVTGGGSYLGQLDHCTLTANSARTALYGGGGSWQADLTCCTIIGNSAPSGYGGGAAYGSINNCLFLSNSASVGGATGGGVLNNCTLVGNSASSVGGGLSPGMSGNPCARNCIVYYNTAPSAPDCYLTPITYSCTPLPTAGVGNFTNEPRFVNLASSNLRLQSNSPCINAGFNSAAPGTTDLDGNPRIRGGTVDVGAYEYQSPASVLSYQWLQQYSLPTDGSADFTDTDGDGMNNWQEWITGTDPADPFSALRLQTLLANPSGLLLRWSSDTNHTYFVQRATSLNPPLSFTTLQGEISGLSGTTTYTDRDAISSKCAALYRVGTASTNVPSPVLLQEPTLVPATVTLTWSSVTNRAYFIQRATTLTPTPAFTLLQTNIPGLPSTTSFTDPSPPLGGPAYYRVGIQQ